MKSGCRKRLREEGGMKGCEDRKKRLTWKLFEANAIRGFAFSFALYAKTLKKYDVEKGKENKGVN